MHVYDRTEAVRRAAEEIETEFGRPPTDRELALRIGEISDGALSEVETAEASGLPIPKRTERIVDKATAKIRRYKEWAHRPISLDDSLDQDLLASQPILAQLLTSSDLAASREAGLSFGDIVEERLIDDVSQGPLGHFSTVELRNCLMKRCVC